MLTLNESLIYSTIKITKIIDGRAVETGTGFFWNAASLPDQVALCIVTNKHVISGAHELVVRFHLSKDDQYSQPSGKFINYTIEVDHSQVVGHPDPGVDLCAVGIGGVIPDLARSGAFLFYRSLNCDNVPKPSQWTSFDAIEDVLMVGCPNGIVDEVNNLPIVRRGITATQMSYRYNGKPEFMVDMACFPGSSGSPIFVNQLGYVDKETSRYLIDVRRFFLVGILYAGPLINSSGIVTFGNAPSVQVATMMHLGNAIQAGEMLTLNNQIAMRLALSS